MRRVVAIVLLALFVCGGACRSSDDEGDAITVFAAASTTDVITRLAERYEAKTGTKVKTSFAASSTLAKQIDGGARADVFLSANPQWMDWLEERDRIRPKSRVDLAANALVLVAPRGRAPNARLESIRFEKDFAIGDALGPRLALGDPSHVPAGTYAKAALEALGWWDVLEQRVVPAQDVRAALGFVELGEADAGVVYATDAAVTPRVEVVGTFPDAVVPPIRYPVALTKDAAPGADAFLAFLTGDEAAGVLREAGFEPLAPGARPSNSGTE